MPKTLPRTATLRVRKKLILLSLASLPFLFYFLQKHLVLALTSTITTSADFSAGTFDGTEADTKQGDLNLRSAGSWGPRVWKTPDVPLTIGTALTTDGDFVYVLEGSGKYFSRYEPDSNTWRKLASPGYETYYGADLTVLGDYVYAIFGGYQRKFSRYSITNDTWEDMSEVPDLIFRGSSLATDGTDIYALRGYNTTDFWKYTAATNTWSVAPSAPAALYYGASLEFYDGVLYTPRGNNTNTFYSYNIESGAWSTMANAPGTFNGDGTGDAKDGYIYYLRNSGTSEFWRYDIEENEWETLTDAPQVSRYAGVVYNASDDQLYVFRGNGTYEFWKYDDTQDAFLGPRDLPATPSTGADLVYYNGYVYYARGTNTTSFYRYNVSNDTWEDRAAAPAAFNDSVRGVVAGGLLYYFRGSNTNEFYSYNPASNSWSTLATAPALVRFGGALAYPGTGDYIYATSGNNTRLFWRYSIGGDTWSDVAVADIPDNGEASYGATLDSDGTDIYYTSGYLKSKMFKYVINTDTWSEVTNLPFAPYFGTDLAYYDGKFYMTAGYYKNEFWEFDPADSGTWRKLDPVFDYFGYEAGAYNGGSLTTNGSGNFFYIRGEATPNMMLYTVDSSKYLESGTWTSAIMDLKYVSSFGSLSSTSTTPEDSTIVLETRSSTDAASWSSWEGLSGNDIASPARRYLQVRASLSSSGDRSYAPTLHSVTVSYSGDSADPNNPSAFIGVSQEVGGASLTSGQTYSYEHPYFSWTGASDTNSSISGYYVYFGTDSGGDPETAGSFQVESDFVATKEMSPGTYYLRLQTLDSAGNLSSAVSGFVYVYSGVPTTSLTVSSSSDFNTGSLTDVSSDSDELKLSSKAGFWQQERLSITPAAMRMGSDMAWVSSTGKLYAYRGNGTNNFYEYDISSDTWTALANTPGTVTYGGSLVEGPPGYLYGLQGNNTATFWRYDIDDDLWEDVEAADIPLTVYDGASLSYDGSRYIYALRSNNDNAFFRYDTVENAWSSLRDTDFGAPEDQVSNNVYVGADLAYDGENTIYAMQGNLNSGFSAYSIEDDTWTVLPELPALPSYGGNLAYNSVANAVYFIPGRNTPFFYKYDIESGEWEELPEAPQLFFYGTGMRSVGEDLYIIRGNNSQDFYKYSVTDDSWLIPTRGLFGGLFRGTELRNFNYGADIVKGDGNNLYMTRGNGDNLFIRYDYTTGSVTQVSNPPASFYTGGAMAYDSTANKIYASSNTYDNSLYIYDIATDTWSEDTDDPFPFDPNTGTSMAYDGSRYIYWLRGGGTTTFYRYDTQGTTGSRWQSQTSVTASVNYGSQLVYKGGYLYTLRGSNVNPNPLYRFNPSGGTWSSLTSLGAQVYNDGFLVDGGGDYLYACRGANAASCFRYSITNDLWESIADAPAQIYTGGAAATDGAGKMYVIPGAGTSTYADGLYTYVLQTGTTSFEESGEYISAAHDLGAVYKWGNISVTYSSAANADIEIQTRTSADGTDWSSWGAVSEEKKVGAVYTYKINSTTNRYLQTKFDLTSSDGVYSGVISDYSINYYQDGTDPTNPTSLSAYSDSGMGTPITSETWYSHPAPHFSWPDAEAEGGASDTANGAGVIGYFVYFGTNPAADPAVLGTETASPQYTASGLTTGETYYLRIKTVDDAGNISESAWEAFMFKFDNGAPNAPAGLSVTPSGYSTSDQFDFSWGAVVDSASGTSGYCYKTGASSGAYSTDQCTSSTSIADVPPYQSGTNTFYVRTKDNAGGYSPYATVSFYYSEEAPSPPQNLTATPETNTENSFAFSWDPPSNFFGSEDELVYRYSINAMPTQHSTTATSNTSLEAGAYATLPGENTFYIVAMDEAGNVDYSVYESVTFTADTTAPGIPTSLDAADVSVKATSSWKIALSWEAPEDLGAGVASYKIYRSADNSTFSQVASTAGISYVDTGLDQQTYYYKIKACDNANNCGAFSSVTNLFPDGKFTVAAPLVSEPEVTGVTTKKATISWVTSRSADSRVAYGTSSGDYGEEEVSNSSQVTSHTLQLTNLSPGTKYYFVAKWTDEDGNLGTSEEGEFETTPAPSAKEVTAVDVGLTSGVISFTSSDAASAKIYYGETTSFGGYKEINVSSSESTYTVPLDGLADGTKYYFKVNLLDIEASEYDGDTYSFETLPRPAIDDVVITQISGLAQPTVLVTWNANTDISSIVSYYPSSDPGQAKDAVDVALTAGRHRTIVGDLVPQTGYVFRVSGKDIAGNEATSGEISFSTLKDARPPLVSDLKIEGNIIKTGDGNSMAQLVVSWKTDEPATSQVEYGEGSGTTYSQKTQEDANMTSSHLVVISNLTPSKVYHLKVFSRDEAGNAGTSVDSVTITPKATDAALDLVVNNLSEVFGFLGAFGK